MSYEFSYYYAMQFGRSIWFLQVHNDFIFERLHFIRKLLFINVITKLNSKRIMEITNYCSRFEESNNEEVWSCRYFNHRVWTGKKGFTCRNLENCRNNGRGSKHEKYTPRVASYVLLPVIRIWQWLLWIKLFVQGYITT